MLRKMVDTEICKALQNVLENMGAACKRRPPEFQAIQPRLVAVAKTKPVSMVKEAYKCGQRHFGENYVHELFEKSTDPEVMEQLSDIRWHFIGHLQKDKVKKLLCVPNLFVVETMHSAKIATRTNELWKKIEKDKKLKVMLQINTSGEESKHGCKPSECIDLAKHIEENCTNLEMIGVMTIGAFDHDLSKGPNPDFQVLKQCKQEICDALSKDPNELELSMGMSNDYEHAIEVGSSNVRVGSTIFGARDYKPKDTKNDVKTDVKQIENQMKDTQIS